MSSAAVVPNEATKARKAECSAVYRGLMTCLYDYKLPANERIREFFIATSACDDFHDFKHEREDLSNKMAYFDKSALNRILAATATDRDELIAQQNTKEARDMELYYKVDQAVRKLNPIVFKKNT
jgi:hypothetical protein